MIDINKYNISEYEYRKTIEELQKNIDTLNEEKKELETKNNEMNWKLNRLYSSIIWKISKPVRKILFHRKKSKKSENDEVYENDYRQYPIYESEYQDNLDFSKYKTDIKTIAFYLPQFHTFKENDEWWGKGFMEWTNTKKAVPRFEGHYQPRIPHKDIGYYTLDNKETIKRQVELAKMHGLYGFCFYYYWFSGKRLMEKPVDIFLENKDIDFPFCLCWANENWTRTWDGLNKNVLIEQKYSKQDYKKFIQDIKKYIVDDRYIKIDNKPVIIIYNPNEIPNFGELCQQWRKYAREMGIGEIYLISQTVLVDTEHKFTEFVDAEYDFPPHGIGHKEAFVTGTPTKKALNYRRIVDDIGHIYKNQFNLKPCFYTCTMGWDNSARRKEDYLVYIDYALDSYYKWLRMLINETRRRNPEDRRILFINAWNEWAEGTYLEPDEKYGYANINTLSKAIYDIPLNKKIK